MTMFSAPEVHGSINPWDQSSRFDRLFQTTDRKQAEEFILSYQVRSASHVCVNIGANVNTDLRGFVFADLQVGALRYGTDVSARFMTDATGADQPWFFIYNLGGQSLGRRLNLQTNPGDAIAFQNDGQADYLLSPNFEALTLRVSARDMAQAFCALYDHDVPPESKLTRAVQAGSAAALTLLRTISRLSEIPKYPHHAAHRLERGIKETALLEILMNWPGAILPTIKQTVLPASTRLARDFIHAHIKDLPTVSEVAASCRIGVRALDRGFKKHLGVSPLQYMLDLRLQGVHDDLIAKRNGDTVTEVATYWGFLNLGIFAARYRERFGELPSKTLLQSRQLRQSLN